VLQALARYGVLRHFHYLSTVSGGRYIGSWLSAWRFHKRDDDAVFAELIKRGGYSVEQNDGLAEPAELRELRANSNFLTPKLGLLSADTWTGSVARTLKSGYWAAGSAHSCPTFMPSSAAP
jgi:hypothetical protein